MKKRILIIGGMSTELSMQVEQLANEKKEVCAPMEYMITPGGTAALAAVAVSRLGGDVILCSAVGDDTYGSELIRFFDELGMDTRFIKTVKGEKTAIDLHCADEDTSRTYKSTSMLSAIDADLVEDAFTTLPDAVYISMDLPAESVIRAAELAREKKVLAFFDGQRISDDFPLDQLGVIDLIALPPEKTEHFTGIRPRNAQSNLEAAVELHKTVCSKTYLFKFGVGGAFAYKGNFSYYIPYVEGANERYTDLLIPSMIVETLRSGKNVRGARYASTVIALAARKGNIPILSVPNETEVLRYVLENEIEF